MPWLLRMTLLVSGIMLVAHLYLGWRLTRATGYITRRPAVARMPLILLASFYLFPLLALILYLVNGGVEILKFYKPVPYWFWFGFAFTFQILSWVIVYDIIKLISHWRFNDNQPLINRGYGWLVILTVCSMLVFSGAKMVRDTNRINVENVSLEVEALPGHLEGMRIVHISDIQGDEYTGEKEIARYVEKVNELEPDLVVFTGDLVSYGTEFIGMSAREFGKIDATYGVFSVVGDHDYWAGLSNINPELERNGIPMLEDENRFVGLGGDSLLLTGITHVYSQRVNPEVVRGLASDSARVPVKILASHQISDELISQARANGYNLLLAGHTHGGQVRVPLFGKTYSASDVETSFVSGQYWESDLLINVNNGLGFTLAPVRYNAPPTITVIELTGK